MASLRRTLYVTEETQMEIIKQILSNCSDTLPTDSKTAEAIARGAAPEEIAAISSLDPQTGARSSSQYEYDPRGYLVRQLFSSGEELHRQADPVGNLFRSADQRDRKYGPGGRIEQANGTTYELDADGFLTKKTLSDGATWNYAWDAHGQLIEVARPDGGVVKFTYDAFGRRTSKTYAERTTEYVWDGDDLVHERVRGEDGEVASPLTTWVFEPGTFTPVAKIEGRKRYGIVTDHLGSPTMLATEAGKIAWKAQLDVYGVPRQEALTGADAAAESERTSNPWRFPGQYEDAETGLYYNRFRYYDPELGRYLSEDPIGLLGGTAMYGYVEDSALWIDPFGLKACNINRLTKKRLLSKKPKQPGNWHMHHIVMEGRFSKWGKEARGFVTKSRSLLKRNNVSMQGDDNVVWALNKGHSTEYAKKVYEDLAKAEKAGGASKVREALTDIGNQLREGTY